MLAYGWRENSRAITARCRIRVNIPISRPGFALHCTSSGVQAVLLEDLEDQVLVNEKWNSASVQVGTVGAGQRENSECTASASETDHVYY